MILWSYPPRCLDPHPHPARLHHETLAWSPARTDREVGQRVRVLRGTCGCEATFYELCQTGDLRFIRRIRRLEEDLAVEESDRRPAAEADAMWTALMSGLAR